jgi:hypothetical protein
MIFPAIYGRALSAAATIASIALSLPPVSAQYSADCGIISSKYVSLSSSCVIDSFDSSNSFKSTNGLYDSAKRQVYGNVCLLNSTGSDFRNAFVYGNVQYSGPAIKNTANVQGTISTPFSSVVAAASDPTWAAGTFAQYTGGGAPPVTSPANTFMAAGTVDDPTKVKVNGDFTVPGGKSFRIASASGTDSYLQVWVTGKLPSQVVVSLHKIQLRMLPGSLIATLPWLPTLIITGAIERRTLNSSAWEPAKSASLATEISSRLSKLLGGM